MIAYQARIMERFMSEEAIKEFHANYKAVLKIASKDREIIPTDRLIMKDYRSGMPVNEIMEKYGRSRERIMGSIIIASKDLAPWEK